MIMAEMIQYVPKINYIVITSEYIFINVIMMVWWCRTRIMSIICNNFSFINNRSSKTILRELGMKATNYDFDVSMMLVHLFVFKSIAYILLKRRLKTE